jgi:hypothetical protein
MAVPLCVDASWDLKLISILRDQEVPTGMTSCEGGSSFRWNDITGVGIGRFQPSLESEFLNKKTCRKDKK